jgi:hypothetical protein
VSLFRDKLSFLSLGIDISALNRVVGLRIGDIELNELEAILSSSNYVKKLKSSGRVMRLLEAKSRILSLLRFLSLGTWEAGILLNEIFRVSRIGKCPSERLIWSI